MTKIPTDAQLNARRFHALLQKSTDLSNDDIEEILGLLIEKHEVPLRVLLTMMWRKDLHKLEGTTTFDIAKDAKVEVPFTGSEGKNSYRVPISWRFDLIPPLVTRRLAAVYEEGSIKYGDAKYIEKPLPFSVVKNHLENHLGLWCSGDRTEDHLAKVLWGVATLMTLEALAEDGFIESMNDLSKYGAKATEALQVRLDNSNQRLPNDEGR